MLNKITLALSAALVLGAVSTASAQYDPWIVANNSYVAMSDGALNAFASTPVPHERTIDDARDDASRW